MNEPTRLNKFIAAAGICSRRDADKLIAAGKITVNGQPAEAGYKVLPTDEVRYGKKLIGTPQKKVVLAYYKPIGVTCSERDSHSERLITKELKYPIRVTYAGRLDRDSEGLILMTNDGDLIDRLMRGANAHEKEYVVKVKRELTEDFLNKMAAGVYLPDLEQTTRPCDIKQTGKFTFRIILTQGLNRQIRRMCKACGNEVISLKRIRVANVELGNLKPGEYREVKNEELQQLYKDPFYSASNVARILEAEEQVRRNQVVVKSIEELEKLED